ncbi:MAG TPA: antibiotic biosynthesis monooxygenase [Actinomycetota bacterium]|nr:antibiotic biosynthesis monooxygenase [Actinomycetota bacterium]
MYAVVVRATLDPGRAQEARAQLESAVIPFVKQVPGAVSGYWMQAADGTNGISVVLFQEEDQARKAAEMVPNVPRPEFVTLGDIEVREVVGSF